MTEAGKTTRIGTVVVGGGQAGLAVGYHLKRRGIPFVILDAQERAGDAWRRRWDSLRLFTVARYTGLPGMRFPGRGDLFPTKDDMAAYLEAYALRFALPLRFGMRVDRLARAGNGFVLTAGGETFECDQVIVAMANYQAPRVPAFARDLDPKIRQLHAHEYKNPSQLADGSVLIVGVGNSGADIAIELAGSRETWMAGKETGHIPFPIETPLARFVLVRGVRFLGHHLLSLATPVGRKLRPQLLHRASPLVRVKPNDLVAAGVRRVPRVVGVQNGKPLLADQRVLDVANVLWCTGYEHGFPWIDLPIFDEHGEPAHERGVVAGVPGLYFVGLHFLYAMTSATLLGVGRDAEHVVRAVESRAGAAQVA